MKRLKGGVGDALSVIDTMTDQPKDLPFGIGHDELAALLMNGDVTVGQIVACQFCALHAQRLESVAWEYRAYGQREVALRSV